MSNLQLAPLSNLPVLPVVVSLLFAVLLILGHGRLRYQRAVGAAGVLAALVADLILFTTVLREGPLVYRAGDWPAPYRYPLRRRPAQRALGAGRRRGRGHHLLVRRPLPG